MRGVVTAVVVTFATITIAPRLARADAKPIDYTYEIENLEAYPDKVFVAWPRTCGSTGDPLGTVSLQLNPDWVTRLHEVDYEVLARGKHHQVLPYCAPTTRLFALPSAAFPQSPRAATADDSALGKKPGESYLVLPALDEIELPKRITFFAGDPRLLSSPFRLDVVAKAPGGSPLKAVHDVLAIEGAIGAAATTFAVAPKRAIYTYDDGASEAVPYRDARRPSPSRAGALDLDAGPGTPAAGDASVDADAGVSVAPTPPPHDLGTRWVYAAAIGGIVAGGAIAQYRKKRAASAK